MPPLFYMPGATWRAVDTFAITTARELKKFLQHFPIAAAQREAASIRHHDQMIAAEPWQEFLDVVEIDDMRTMRPAEYGGIEAFHDADHALAHEVGAVHGMQADVVSFGSDVK